jgi:ectoine hydroxylase-related dioxygenase (phytanoyl-CoA dioxygenase family)
MSFIPGSHKLGPLDPVDLGNTTDDGLLQLFPPDKRANLSPVAMPMNAGSCTFHDGLMFHYAGPNVTDAPRRAMVTIFMPEGTTYKKLEHLVGDRSNLTPGEEFHGPLFPIVSKG